MGPHVFRSAVADAEKLQTATLLTEFGALVPDAAHPEGQGSEEIQWVLDEADKSLQGWTYWDIGALVDRHHGGFRSNAMDLFVRPYASAIAGVPTKMLFTRETGKFELAFKPNPNISEPTEVMAPALRYPNGYEVILTGGLEIVPCSRGDMVCISSRKAAKNTAATIALQPKNVLQGNVFV